MNLLTHFAMRFTGLILTALCGVTHLVVGQTMDVLDSVVRVNSSTHQVISNTTATTRTNFIRLQYGAPIPSDNSTYQGLLYQYKANQTPELPAGHDRIILMLSNNATEVIDTLNNLQDPQVVAAIVGQGSSSSNFYKLEVSDSLVRLPMFIAASELTDYLVGRLSALAKDSAPPGESNYLSLAFTFHLAFNNSDDSGKSNTPVIIGATVGSLVVFFAIVGFFLLRRVRANRRRQREKAMERTYGRRRPKIDAILVRAPVSQTTPPLSAARFKQIPEVRLTPANLRSFTQSHREVVQRLQSTNLRVSLPLGLVEPHPVLLYINQEKCTTSQDPETTAGSVETQFHDEPVRTIADGRLGDISSSDPVLPIMQVMMNRRNQFLWKEATRGRSTKTGPVSYPINDLPMTTFGSTDVTGILTTTGCDKLQSSGDSETLMSSLKSSGSKSRVDGPPVCGVCSEEFEAGEKACHLSCRHLFHSECVVSWLTTKAAKCPLCGQRVV
ncbi:hypothetical protein IWQ60_010570 [Tieghemiomyces parasiticus]|uniref:RING-type E3 ubiquitin transferase n=1 Tax=Tieghemiomyces parasiticus TaxID=78921 RepID=A0A9W7ZQG9_9FUNG|nr:hypothetical protein IWQ60_010570 [Tieghemiomyces parasiticus]